MLRETVKDAHIKANLEPCTDYKVRVGIKPEREGKSLYTESEFKTSCKCINYGYVNLDLSFLSLREREREKKCAFCDTPTGFPFHFNVHK